MANFLIKVKVFNASGQIIHDSKWRVKNVKEEWYAKLSLQGMLRTKFKDFDTWDVEDCKRDMISEMADDLMKYRDNSIFAGL